MKKIRLGIATSAALLVLIGCGRSSDPTVTSDSGTGYYVDSAVEGVQYTCGANSGVTGQDGAFTFEIGESCRFELRGIQLREVNAADLVDGVKVLEDNSKVARFLQSIDFDGNPDNGIQIKDEVIEVLTQALEDYNISSDSILNDETALDIVVTEIDNNITDFSGYVVTEEEAIAHVVQTQTEVTTELLAGKTFYVVGQNIIDSNDIRYGEAAFNESLTSMTWTDFVDTQYSGEKSIRIEGNKLLFLSDTDGSYKIIGLNRGDYIEVTDYYADGSVESHTRLYYDKAKADAYVDSLNVSDNVSYLETLIIGKTYYTATEDSYIDENGTLINNNHVETIVFNTDGETVTDTWVENGKKIVTTFSYSVTENTLTLSGTNSDGYFNFTFNAPVTETETYILFSNYDYKFYKSYTAAQAALDGIGSSNNNNLY